MKLGRYLMYSSRGIYPKWKARPFGEAGLVSTLRQRLEDKLKCNHLDVVFKRVDEVKDSRKTRILTRFKAMV